LFNKGRELASITGCVTSTTSLFTTVTDNCEHQAEISIPCQKDCVESQLNQTVTDLKSEQTQSVALLADEPNLSEDISDIDSLCEQEVFSIVDTVFPEKFPIKDSLINKRA
jgi:hypothetical protein